MENGQIDVLASRGDSPSLWDATLAEWLDEYPVSERKDLESRLKSREPASALFELMLHALLIRHNARVTVHPPKVSGNSKRPDFLAVFSDGKQAVFEARIVEEVRYDGEWEVLSRVINGIPSDFDLRSIRSPWSRSKGAPTPWKVWAFLEGTLAKYDAERMREHIEQRKPERHPRIVFCGEGHTIRFFLWPKPHSRRGKPGNNMASGGFLWDGVAERIGKAIDEKATRYGEMGLPYVVAIGVNASGPWDYPSELAEEILFGKPDRGVLGGEFVRSDGTPRHRLVSGVAMASLDWHLGTTRMTLYENPDPLIPACDIPWRLDRMAAIRDDYQFQEGLSVGEMLGLPANWPEK